MLQQYMNQEFQMWKLGLEKADVPEQIQYLLDHSKSKGIKKKIYFCFSDYAKAFDCGHPNKLWQILKKMRIPKKAVCRTRSNS